MLSFIFVIVCGRFEIKRILCSFFVYADLYCLWRSNYQRGKVWIPLTGLTPPQFYAYSMPGLRSSTSYVVGFLFCVVGSNIEAVCSFC